ncbi:MAG TPA: Hsp20/alpha crystallin family protein [Candidatus Limnocylindrales bacterium]|nr:Hsp20/alpha crystallin family protein [Candidatus Limnocylindrales bacterium]
MAMTALSPLGDFMSLRATMDRLFDGALVRRDSRLTLAGTALPYLPLDVYETPDEFVVRALVPGSKPDAIDAQYHDGVLTLRTKVELSGAPEGATWLFREIGAGEAVRRIKLPRAIDIDHATTSFENGVLTLTLPKAPEAKPRQIKVVAEPQLAAPVTY